MSFTPATQYGPQGGSTFTNEVLVLKKEAENMRFITSRLSSMEALTEFRIIPSFTRDGELQTPLNPDFTHGTSIGTLVGPWAYNVEVSSNLGIPHAITSITAVTGDSNGNKPEEKFTPANMVIYNAKWKIREMQVRLEQRLSMEGQPKSWLKYSKGRYPFINLGDPKKVWLVQGLCRQLDGNVFRNKDKQAVLMPGFVLMFNGDLFESMADSIGMRYDQQQPLTPETCGFGDMISLAGGRTIMINKYAKKDQTGNDRPAYKVSLNMSTAGVVPLPEEHCNKFFRQWEDILHIPTVEDSIETLIKALGPEMVDFGLRGTGYEKYLPDTVSGCSRNIPDTVNTKQLKEQGEPQAAQQVAAPTHAPGHPAYTEAPLSSGGYVLPGDPIEGLEPEAPKPPPFPSEESDQDATGQTKQGATEAYVAPDLDSIPDVPAGGDFESVLADVQKNSGN